MGVDVFHIFMIIAVCQAAFSSYLLTTPVYHRSNHAQPKTDKIYMDMQSPFQKESEANEPPEYESSAEETTGEPPEYESSAEETTGERPVRLDELPSLTRGALAARRMKQFKKFISARQIEVRKQVQHLAHMDCEKPRRYPNAWQSS